MANHLKYSAVQKFAGHHLERMLICSSLLYILTRLRQNSDRFYRLTMSTEIRYLPSQDWQKTFSFLRHCNFVNYHKPFLDNLEFHHGHTYIFQPLVFIEWSLVITIETFSTITFLRNFFLDSRNSEHSNISVFNLKNG